MPSTSARLTGLVEPRAAGAVLDEAVLGLAPLSAHRGGGRDTGEVPVDRSTHPLLEITCAPRWCSRNRHNVLRVDVICKWARPRRSHSRAQRNCDSSVRLASAFRTLMDAISCDLATG